MSNKNDKVLQGQVALVTGASSGLGARFADVLADAGAKVALCARRTDRLTALAQAIEDRGGRAIPLRMDVTDLGSIESAVEEAETQLGPISILINNSGVSRMGKLADFTPEDYAFIMDTNVRGAFFVAQAVGKRMLRHKIPGRVINIASVAALRVIGHLGVYCMSKAAVAHMTRAMALEWGRAGINVNAICPGYIRTEMNDDYWSTEGGEKLISMLPRQRVGEAADLDQILLTLASPQVRFINGAVIPVDDGLSVT